MKTSVTNVAAQLRAMNLLDDYLELKGFRRTRWLRRLRRQEPDTARLVEALIAADQTDDDRFDRGIPEFTVSQDQAAELSDLLGKRMGAWRIEEVIGHGGMGAVYRASRADGQFEKDCALKVVRIDMDQARARDRFLEERQLLARLTHPNIASLLDGGVEGEHTPWFAMELIDGEPIDIWCSRKKLDVRARIRLMLGVVDAVRYAHSQLIIHRDIKPSNLLVTAEGKVKLLDFGISALIAERLMTEQNADTQLVTPRFAAPEQLARGPASTGIDIYALGLLLHLLLCGRYAGGQSPHARDYLNPSTRLYETGQMSRFAQGLSRDEASAWSLTPRSLAYQVRGDLDAIVARCLQRDPAHRYAAVGELKRDLGAWLDGRPVLARAQTSLYRTGRFLARHRWPAITLAMILLISLGIVAHIRQQARVTQENSEDEHKMLGLFNTIFSQQGLRVYGDPAFTVKEAADRSLERVQKDNSLDAALKNRMLRSIGGIYAGLGMFAKADQVLTSAVSGAPPGSYDKALALYALSRNASNQEKYADATSLMNQAGKILHDLPSQPINSTLNALLLATLADINSYTHESQPATYLKQADEASQLLKTIDDISIEDESAIRLSLGGAYIRGGEIPKARSMLDALIAKSERAGLGNSDSVFQARDLLSIIYMLMGEPDLARMSYAKRIADWKKTGTKTPELAYALHEYAIALERCGMFEDAVAAMREATGIEASLQADHPVPDAFRTKIRSLLMARALQYTGDLTGSTSILGDLRNQLSGATDTKSRILYSSSLIAIARNDVMRGDTDNARSLMNEVTSMKKLFSTADENTAELNQDLPQLKADICLASHEFNCAVENASLALHQLQENAYDWTRSRSEPQSLLLQRTVAVALMAQPGKYAEGKKLLDTAHEAAVVRYGRCHAITRAMLNEHPVMSLKAMHLAPSGECASMPVPP
ncbi:serine/threonine-protein kinase [Luteibacter rhizovicinus]|nr:serine/threonine-protein kinase [Luteibacter rhizovicinus]